MSSSQEDKTYFGYYAMLTHQQNMLQDSIRTAAYYKAIQKNAGVDFKGKVVLDVGCGSGILSFFAAQAGAARVYAVEAADAMAAYARKLVQVNGLEGVITVISGKIEDVQLPEQVDVIISEPMGVLLVHERMLESFLVGRDRWLKPALGTTYAPSQMYPANSTIHFAPFSDATLYASIHEKVMFWESKSFFGVDLSALRGDAIDHFFGQPIVGGVEPKSLMGPAQALDIRFTKVTIEALRDFSVDLALDIAATGVCHGLATWFDVEFLGSSGAMALSTAPDCPRTHWHQTRLLFRNPLALNRGDTLRARVHFKANQHRSYDITVTLNHRTVTSEHVYFLHDQQYHNLAQQPSLPEDFNLDYLSLYPASL